MKMTWLHKFLGLFFIPADGRAKSAQQLISTVLPFQPLYFSWLSSIFWYRKFKNFCIYVCVFVELNNSLFLLFPSKLSEPTYFRKMCSRQLSNDFWKEKSAKSALSTEFIDAETIQKRKPFVEVWKSISKACKALTR